MPLLIIYIVHSRVRPEHDEAYTASDYDRRYVQIETVEKREFTAIFPYIYTETMIISRLFGERKYSKQLVRDAPVIAE